MAIFTNHPKFFDVRVLKFVNNFSACWSKMIVKLTKITVIIAAGTKTGTEISKYLFLMFCMKRF
jgi:hypothetical protein